MLTYRWPYFCIVLQFTLQTNEISPVPGDIYRFSLQGSRHWCLFATQASTIYIHSPLIFIPSCKLDDITTLVKLDHYVPTSVRTCPRAGNFDSFVFPKHMVIIWHRIYTQWRPASQFVHCDDINFAEKLQ